MPYIALMRITANSDRPHDDAYAVGPYDERTQAHRYGARAGSHPQRRHGQYLGTAELIPAAAFEGIVPAPELSYTDLGGPGIAGDIQFTTNLGHTGTLMHTDEGWWAAGTTPAGEMFSVILAGPTEEVIAAKLRLQRVLDAGQLPSYPPTP